MNFKAVPSKCVILLVPAPEQLFRGSIYSEYYKKSVRFQNEMELLRGMDNLFDSIDFPQATCEYRSFFEKNAKQNIRKAVNELDNTPDEFQENQKTTFIVNVQYRQNATWQGTITWVEENRTQRFRSAFEMLQLMDEAARRGETDVVQWEEE